MSTMTTRGAPSTGEDEGEKGEGRRGTGWEGSEREEEDEDARCHVGEGRQPGVGLADDVEEALPGQGLVDGDVERDLGPDLLVLVRDGLDPSVARDLLVHLALDDGALRGVELGEVTLPSGDGGGGERVTSGPFAGGVVGAKVERRGSGAEEDRDGYDGERCAPCRVRAEAAVRDERLEDGPVARRCVRSSASEPQRPTSRATTSRATYT